LRRLAAAALACAPLAAAASDARWYLEVANDVVFHTDRWYSSGVRLARVSGHGEYELEWGLAQEIYTPEARHFAPGTVDRAPSGRLLASLARHDATATCLRTLEIALGVRGPSAQGRRTTQAVHHLVPAPAVDWTREEGDRIDAQVTAARSQRVGDAVLHFGGVAGTTRIFGHAGAQWDFGTGIESSLMRFAPTPPAPAGDAGWGGFVGVSARAVARDATLERNYDPFLPALERERLVGRLAAGVGAVRRWGSVTFTVALDSREFEGQRAPQAFGALAVHIAF
jgi:hypothetical protein